VSEPLKPVYLITGNDRPKVELALARLRDRVGEDAVERHSTAETSGADAVALCNAGALFLGEARVVVVDDVDGRRNQDGRLVGAWKKADIEAVVDYVADPAPGTVLVLVGEEIRKDSPLAKACTKTGDVLAFDVAKKELPTWVIKRFERAGIRIDRDTARLLVDLVGDDLQALGIEVEKLEQWAGDETKTIGERDVEALVSATADTPPWTLTDPWGRRDVRGVLAATEEIFERSADSRSGVLLRLAASMTRHVTLVRACQRLEAEGVSQQQAAQRLGYKSAYPVQKAFDHARNYSAEELADAVVRLAHLDHSLKGGSRLAGELELERTFVEITRRAEAPGRKAA
jgi:DNA polymerase-3 subunit delta